MSMFQTYDLKNTVITTVNQVFETMLSINMAPIPTIYKSQLDGPKIVGSVSFSGDVLGSVSVHLSNSFAKKITSIMLDMDEEIPDKEEINDVIREISNMIGGNLKSDLCDHGMPCCLSIPSVTSGNDFIIEISHVDIHDFFAFQHEDDIAFVDVYIGMPQNSNRSLIESNDFPVEIQQFDLKFHISDSVKDVFDTMLSMDITDVLITSLSGINGQKIVGSVGLAGKIQGSVSIELENSFARLLTSEMLGTSIDEVNDDEEIHDVIREITNMIGGRIKSEFCDSGLTCELSIPSITTGSDFEIDLLNLAKHERYTFQYQNHVAFVQVYVKAS